MTTLPLLALLALVPLDAQSMADCSSRLEVTDGKAVVQVRTITCGGKPVIESRLEVIQSEPVGDEHCVFRIANSTRPLAECVPGVHDHCVENIRREYTAFRFGLKCRFWVPVMPFELSGDVDVGDIDDFMRDFDLARALVRNPRGLGWTAPMDVLASARLSDIDALAREKGRWRVYLSVCDKTCVAMQVDFSARPSRLDQINAGWVD